MQPQRDLRLIRKLDTTFLSNLKKMIKEDPSGPGVPPVAVLCIDVQQKDAFSERLKESYKYEVLGGQHTTAAKAELFHENPNNPLYNQVFAEVFVGLNDKEALRLASRHNDNGHFIHRMTHKDYVSSGLFQYILIIIFIRTATVMPSNVVQYFWQLIRYRSNTHTNNQVEGYMQGMHFNSSELPVFMKFNLSNAYCMYCKGDVPDTV